MNIAGAFGGGMGNMEGTCGALVGAGLVLGLVNKDKAAIEREEGKACFDSPEREQARLKAKVKSMKQMRQIMTKFQERNGATQCKLLKGIGTKVMCRDNVQVTREADGKRKVYVLDLRSSDVFNSPAYYLQQNDIVYVEPNSVRAGQSTINENYFKSGSFWVSMGSLAITVVNLVATLSRNRD